MTTAGSLEKANKDTVFEPIITTSRKSGLGDAQKQEILKMTQEIFYQA